MNDNYYFISNEKLAVIENAIDYFTWLDSLDGDNLALFSVKMIDGSRHTVASLNHASKRDIAFEIALNMRY